MKRYVWLILIMMVITSCESVDNHIETQYQSTSFVLGFSQLGSESGWRIGNTASIKKASEDYGVDLIYLNAEQKYENQIKHLRRFIANQVDIIAFSPIVSTGWDNVLKEAKDAGIPVIITDRGITTVDESLYTTFIGSDFEAEGRKAANFLMDYYSETDKEIRIVELRGTDNSTPALGRSAGFRTILEENKNMEIVYSTDGDFMNARGKEIMKDILKSNLTFDVIYSHNDAMTYGAIVALEEAGLMPGMDVVIVSVDGEQESIELLKQGKINCVVECTPLIGNKLMEISSMILRGEAVPKEIYSNETVFTMWDDLTDLPERGY